MRLTVLTTLTVLLWSSEALAIEVMCNDGPAECSIESVVGTFMCSCGGQPGSGSTGASENPWADMTEEELMAECEMMLPDACQGDETSGGGDATATDDATATSSGTGDPTDTGPNSSTSLGTATDTMSGGTDSETASATATASASDSATDGDGSSDKSGCSIASDDLGLAGLVLLPLLARTRRRR